MWKNFERHAFEKIWASLKARKVLFPKEINFKSKTKVLQKYLQRMCYHQLVIGSFETQELKL